ncbi:XRE family transcriptional regulator [Spirosoma pollinicola]|uniref:HTH cro/C1-type domain-containing protein n=1 Tax=Spirosoma pollinicola TaxID=2057025 RepID=A0A2K8YTN4_9BACT|nr:LexA family transcriptional regulator [Spirosoma pollinicola]AUD00983.1 hypothetical protein CWM47_03600 [Spirosoma pollinicola]
MSLAHLIKQGRKNRGWTQQQLADASGVKREIIAKVETGKSGFGADNQKAIADVFGISPVMLEFVKSDSQIITKDKQSSEVAKNVKPLVYFSQLPEKDADLYIPYYDVEITAGRIELYFDDVDEIPEGYIYAPQYRDCIACNVKGDSMYDRIFPGSRLYVYHLPNKKYIDFGQIYLVVLDGYRLLKYVHPHPSDETKIVLSSYNKHYSDWSVDRVDILNLFLVKGYENQNAI